MFTFGSGEDGKFRFAWDTPKLRGPDHNALISDVVVITIHSMHSLVFTLGGRTRSWGL